ncbi:MAG: outer membrane beta-barrel protein [Bacteroidales bacterium]|nr:outer membrane beta-barrel protein [Bacteroidales bacterium]
MAKKLLLFAAVLVGVVSASAQNHIEFRWHGYYGVGEYAFMTNLNTTKYNDTANLNGFTFVSGFQFRKEAGLGLGFTFLSDPRGSFTQLPVFFELRSHYSRSRLSPFSVLQLGYTIPLGTTGPAPKSVSIEEGGLYFGLNGGVRYAITRNVGVNLNVGYQLIFMNDVRQCDPNGIPALNDAILFHMFRVGAGINF